MNTIKKIEYNEGKKERQKGRKKGRKKERKKDGKKLTDNSDNMCIIIQVIKLKTMRQIDHWNQVNRKKHEIPPSAA